MIGCAFLEKKEFIIREMGEGRDMNDDCAGGGERGGIDGRKGKKKGKASVVRMR